MGIVQGITEWIPVSSDGSVTAVASLLFGMTLSEAFLYAMWLHLGTAFAALIVFRKTIQKLASDLFRQPLKPTPLLVFLIATTAISGAIALPIVILVQEASGAIGALAMAVVGTFMIVTGLIQMRQPSSGMRLARDVRPIDGVVAGIAQGLAAIPGLSRSGMTIAVLLARGFDRREALFLSFLMSVPVTFAAGLYGGWKTGISLTAEALAGFVAAFGVGLLTVRALLALAGRVNFGVFVLATGVLLIASAVVQVLFF